MKLDFENNLVFSVGLEARHELAACALDPKPQYSTGS